MEDDLTIKDLCITRTHPYKIKVYRVQINHSKTNNIWYAGKKGQYFYAVLSAKEIFEGFTAVFRVIKLSENKEVVYDSPFILDIYPNDCVVIEEMAVRSKRSLRHLTFGVK